MERTWTIRGAYANWTMTITVDPPDEEEEVPPLTRFPTESFGNLGPLFREAIDLFEALRDNEQLTGRY